ncbi:phosphoribosylglycinamide formyltransferase [bacterium]|nr:MAG: phosphoribosylglycinamide formyltransferase [bacterium]
MLVFASGSGSNFQSIIDAIDSGALDAQICGLIVNKEGIGAIERAQKKGIPVFHISEKQTADYSSFAQLMLATCLKLDPDVIALAGYMRKIPVQLIQAFEGRILNIHPALLPKFGGKGMYGMNVHRAVVEAKESETGCTIHVVTEEFDEGPILAQAKVPVYETDSAEDVQKRVLTEEHKLYPNVLQQFLNSI